MRDDAAGRSGQVRDTSGAALALLALLASAAPGATPPPFPGQVEESGVIPSGRTQGTPYAAWVPAKRSSGTLALILALHGMGGNERSLLFYVGRGLHSAGLTGDAVVLGIKSRDKGWSDADHEHIDEALAWAQRTWPIAPRRIYGYGISHGAMRLGIYAPRNQAHFAAVVLMSGNVQRLPASDGDQDTSFYLMHGDQDEVVSVEQGRQAYAALTAKRYPALYRELSGEKHIYSREATYACHPDAVRWLFAHRGRRVPLSWADAAAVQALRLATEAPSANAAALVHPLAELAGPEVDDALAAALGARDARLRAEAAKLCVRRLYGRMVIEALARCAVDADADVRAAAIAGLAPAACWGHAPAQGALATLARDAHAPPADRVAAAGSLAAAYRMQRICSRRDAAVEETLRALGSDASSQLREIAQRGLAGEIVLRDGRPQVEAAKPAATR